MSETSDSHYPEFIDQLNSFACAESPDFADGSNYGMSLSRSYRYKGNVPESLEYFGVTNDSKNYH